MVVPGSPAAHPFGWSLAEQQSQLSVWAEEASPLLISTNLATLTPDELAALKNPHILAIDQSGAQAPTAITSPDGHLEAVFKKADGGTAVLFANLGTGSSTATFSLSQFGITAAKANGYNVWKNQTTTFSGIIPAAPARRPNPQPEPESCLHYVRDTASREDASTIHTGHSPANMLGLPGQISVADVVFACKTSTMHRPEPVEAASALVCERFPRALQAWLGGSAYAGHLTATSDLDVTVLLGEAEVHRESLTYRGWPVELFVHTSASVRHFVEKDVARRKPSMARLVASSLPILPGTEGAQLRSYCLRVLDEGPPALSGDELRLARYFITDLLDDLDGGGRSAEMDAVVGETWRRTAELLLMSERRWVGSGKWLMREVAALDEDCGTRFVDRFHDALDDARAGGTSTLTSLADDVLDRVGGRLRDGFYLLASLPPDTNA